MKITHVLQDNSRIGRRVFIRDIQEGEVFRFCFPDRWASGHQCLLWKGSRFNLAMSSCSIMDSPYNWKCKCEDYSKQMAIIQQPESKIAQDRISSIKDKYR